MCRISSKLTIKTPEQHQSHINYEHISRTESVFLLLTLNR